MINKNTIKIGIISLLTFTLFVEPVYARDIFYSVDTPIVVNGHNYIIGSGSRATYLSIEDSTIAVFVPEDSFFIFKSVDRFDLINNYNEAKCGTSFSMLTVTGQTNFTITPDTATICTINDDSLETSISPVPPVLEPVLDESEKPKDIIDPLKTSLPIDPNAPIIPIIPEKTEVHIYDFGTTTLKNGSRGDAVKELQKFLNQALSLGLVVDGKLGPKTIIVIKKWQTDNGLKPDGLIGIKTKNKMIDSIKLLNTEKPINIDIKT